MIRQPHPLPDLPTSPPADHASPERLSVAARAKIDAACGIVRPVAGFRWDPADKADYEARQALRGVR